MAKTFKIVSKQIAVSTKAKEEWERWYTDSLNKASTEGRMTLHAVVIDAVGASMLLEHNTLNRNMVESVVKRYMTDMQRFRWEVNGESIKISKSGDMIDGQHRCWAALYGETQFPADITFGLDDKVRSTLDQGAKRSPAHALQMAGNKGMGIKHAAALNLLIIYDRPGEFIIHSDITPTRQDLVNELSKYPNLRDHILAAERYYHSLKAPSVAQVAMLMYVFSRIDKEANNYFWDLLGSGLISDESNPIYRLRTSLLRMAQTGKTHLDVTTVLGLVIKGWNMYRQNKRVKVLSYSRTKGELFPRAI